MEYLRHITVRKDGKFYHAVCVRCGLRASAVSDHLLTRVYQNHLCRRNQGSKAPMAQKKRA